MNPKTGELILADTALYIGTVNKVIQKAETEPLTPKTISKRHIRILMALCKNSATENAWTPIGLRQIRKIVAEDSGKLYPEIDIHAFTFDLNNRGYVEHGTDEEEGDVFMVLPEGLCLLDMAKRNLAPHINESNTPNFYNGTRH